MGEHENDTIFAQIVVPERRTPKIQLTPLPSLSRLVGREAEVNLLLEQLQLPQRRLISVVGPGGMGKTTLALHTADKLSSQQFADGVVVVMLAAVTTTDDVLLAIADALGYTFQGARPIIDQLIDALREASVLLVLDNMEHLLGDQQGFALTTLLSRLLGQTSNVRLLITTRERLRIREEWVLELRGLGIPSAEFGSHFNQAESVQLFVERAQQTDPSFQARPEHRAAIAQICRQLDGMPLALELAAGWTRALLPDEIAAELQQALDFLTTTARDVSPRHSSIRAALDHSWRLLNEEERSALAKLSVFHGGCERDALTTITGATLPTIMSLLDKSLLRRETIAGVAHYTLHELVRQFAAERLNDDTEIHRSTAERHSSYYAQLLQQSIDPQTGASTSEARVALVRNIDNLRAAWAYAAATHNAGLLGCMLRGFWILFDDNGWLLDGAAVFGRAADVLRDGSPEVLVIRGHILGLHGYFLTRAAQFRQALPIQQEGLAILKASGTREGLAPVLTYLGISLFHVARLDEAQEHFTQAAELALVHADHFLHRWTQLWLGVIANAKGDYELAETYATAFYEGWHGVNYQRGEAVGLVALAELAQQRGNSERALGYLHQSLQLGGIADDTLTIALSLMRLGALAIQHGELNEACYLLGESAAMMRELGDPWETGKSLALLVRANIGRGDVESARKACMEMVQIANNGESVLLGEVVYCVALLHERVGSYGEAWALLRLLDHIFVEYDTKQQAALLQANLNRRLSSDQQAVVLHTAQKRQLQTWLQELTTRPLNANSLTLSVPTASATTGVRVVETGETLSPREVEVLRLVIGGAGNQHIADTLVISLHTAKHHVASILQKLGVATRTQAAARGRSLGLEPILPE